MKTVPGCMARVILSVLLTCIAASQSYPQQPRARKIPAYLQNKNYALQLGMYDLFTSTRADVVMLGNSLTYNANWNEILNRSNIANRGIASDITSGYLHRLDYVYRLHPLICFIEGGINDLYSNDSAAHIAANVMCIVDSLRSHGIVAVIQSTLCVAATYPRAREKNRQVVLLNELLRRLALERAVEFLDINILVSVNGFLRKDLTPDGIHLNARGYSLWAQEIEKVLTKYDL
jgi:lysophospholipase L1-like esterase